jgi:hypothetical protein
MGAAKYIGEGKLVRKKRGSGFSLVYCYSFVGGSHPKTCAQRTAECNGRMT